MSGLPRRRLGAVGREVSVLGLGGAGVLMNQHAVASDAEAIAAVHAALDEGITLFDTAPAYDDGAGRTSERRLGKALHGRDDVLITTKVGADITDGAWTERRSAKEVRSSIEKSCRALRRDTLDAVQVHEVSRENLGALSAAGGTLEALRELRDRGHVRWIGVTGSDPAALEAAIAIGAFDLVQLWRCWNLLDRSGEPVLAAAADHGLGVIVGGPFASGILSTGRRDSELHYARPDQAAAARVESLSAELERRGTTLAAGALAWCLDPRASAVLTGVDGAGQIRENARLVRELPSRSLVSAVLEGA